ncbi:uncharacterized protein MONOS_12194 [Monocercomonoides exilis]|uniref:uncharacterized protein n=1 Tax=Monocercomonoides exilis TaxID=2049356 RepID=UPI0035595968|nr:hypothetical protein MONOS_12194 [Monocercomonoides exilis]|eukprot:MONOS_12194.1-p1 / transcript=MONOS_12194.1 / gene=MONOS_12194 / organism=Monocercomonoides_exilis_PA203 / gene_product=unspecified product / transcript_product=unspecified product / location=Mono_scaffold00658:6258-7412(-) / protein_length=385 / sequence_SO=supercontig / SO=protein_coding / is_pseudo=false
MNRLTQIEAARVISVLRDTQDKLQILLDLHLDLITPEIPPEFVPEDILEKLNQHKELETKFSELVEIGKELKQTSHRAKIKENQNETREIADKIKESSIQLERQLKESPGTMDQLRLLGNRTDTAKRFLGIFDELVKLSQVRLQTTVEEELEKIKRMEVLATKESKILTDKASLKKEYEAEDKTRSKEVQALRENEQRLFGTIQKIKADNKAFLAKCNADLVTMTEELQKQHQRRMLDLKSTHTHLEEELSELQAEHRTKEREVRKTKQQTSQEIENRIAGYDSGMQEKRTAHIKAEEKLVSEKEEIEELEKKISELDRKAKLDEFERKLEEKREETRKAEAAKRHRQIAIIQALFRRRQAIKVGEALKKAAARKGKKGKKKKK